MLATRASLRGNRREEEDVWVRLGMGMKSRYSFHHFQQCWQQNLLERQGRLPSPHPPGFLSTLVPFLSFGRQQKETAGVERAVPISGSPCPHL